jgi:hypothetical protein
LGGIFRQDIAMRMAVEVGSFGVDAWMGQKMDPTGRVLLRVLWRLSRQPSESLELIIGRSIDQAFAAFAREMAG